VPGGVGDATVAVSIPVDAQGYALAPRRLRQKQKAPGNLCLQGLRALGRPASQASINARPTPWG
jgi:hypothetical protein